MKKSLVTLIATAFGASLSLAQLGVPSDAGLIARTPTIDVNTNNPNSNIETGDISITANFNVVPCWEDDGSGITDWEAVWTVYNINGVRITPTVTMTNLPSASCIPTADSVPNFIYRAFFRSNGSPTPGYTGDYGGKLKANQFGNGFMFCAGADAEGCEIPELININTDAAGGPGSSGSSPIVQLLNNDGSRNAAIGGPDVAGIVSFSDADVEPFGSVRPGDVDFLSNGNLLIVGESRQTNDLALNPGQASGNVVVYKVLSPVGGVVHAYSAVNTNPVATDIWHGTAALPNGFMVRWDSGGAKFRLFDNNGNPKGPVTDLATVAGHPEAGQGGKGDSLGFKSNGKDAYALFVPNSTSGPWLTVLNADGTLRYSRSVTGTNADGTWPNGDRGDVAISDDGSVICVFDATNNDPGFPGRVPQARRFDPCGRPVGPVFYVSERDNPTNTSVAVVSNGNDRPRVAWRGDKIAVQWSSANNALSLSKILALRIFDVGPRPASLDALIPCSVETLGLKHIVPDTLVWFSTTENKPKIGNFVATTDAPLSGSREATARLLGDSTFLLAASTFATNDSTKGSRTLVLIPTTGGTPNLDAEFYDDAGQIYLKDSNTVRQDGNPGRVGGDMRYGAVNYMTAAEATLFNFPASFNSDGRFNNTFFNTILGDGGARTFAAQNFQLNPSTLAVTPLHKALDVIFYPENINATPPLGVQLGRSGSSPLCLANGNFVVVGEDRSKVNDPTSGNVAIAKIFKADGTIVKPAWQVSPVGSNGSMWDSVGAWSGGFFVKPQGGITYCYDNGGNLQGSFDVNATAGVVFDTGRSDGTRYCSDIRSHYIFGAGKSPESGFTNMMLCAWDANTRLWITNTIVTEGSQATLNTGGTRFMDRANVACDAYDRVTVAYRYKADNLLFPNDQIVARVFQFDGTKFTPLTPEFFPFVENDQNPSQLAGFVGLEPSVAMTPREILIYAKGSWNATGHPTNTVVTLPQTHCYTIISSPAPLAAPRPTMTVTKSGTHAFISWAAEAGLFKVQKTTSLTSPSWTDVTSGNVATPVDAGVIGATPTYYRLIR